LVAKDRKFRAASPSGFCFLLVFIGYPIGVNFGPFRSIASSVTCDDYVTIMRRCKAFIVTFFLPLTRVTSSTSCTGMTAPPDHAHKVIA
jgi:hypothetical protein